MAIDEVIASLTASRADGPRIGWIAAVHGDGGALIALTPEGAPVPARTIVPLRAEDAGREALLAFLDGDMTRPVVLGLLQGAPAAGTAHVEADGERIIIRGDQEIVLQCGKASLTLTRAGKVLIRGAYVLSRSSGVNRIKGGSVQIN